MQDDKIIAGNLESGNTDQQELAKEKITAMINDTIVITAEQLHEAEKQAQSTLQELEQAEKASQAIVGGGEEAATDSQEDAPTAVDAKVIVTIAPGGLEAYVEVFPPAFGGAEATPRYIRFFLDQAGVNTGIIDSALFGMAINKPYGKGRVLVAQGTPKQDGVDSIITEHFAREIDKVPFKNNDGTVDFKKLNIIREIKAGTVIATMTAPTPGSEGITVKGEVLKPKPGTAKSILRGNNTTLSEDGMTLTAAINGQLTYVDRFSIEPAFVVEGSVDNNTGNISFCGDILIKGEVREGYEIRSGGTVRVKGAVEGANIYADKDIIMEVGYNGMKHGEVSAKCSITSKFLQNCNAYAKESITTEAIINSVVDCDGTINCTKGKGTVVGGKITALSAIEADTIGSDVNTPTNINVGLSPTVISEKQKLEKEVKEVEDAKEDLHKNLVYLERCAKMGPLSPKNLTLVETCNKQKVILMMREGKATRRLAEVNAIIDEAAAGSYVRAKIIYPSVKVTIQNLSYMNKLVQNRVIVRREDGDIKVATF